MPAAKRCCRSCPRCDDCPVLAMAAARAKRRESATASLITEILGGMTAQRTLPEPVAQTLEALDAARRGEPALAAH